MTDYRSLNHSKWECKYHVVFIPKYRKKVIYGRIRRYLGEVLRRLAEHRESWVEEGHLFQNYKQLQFFDTLALYFNCAHDGARGEQAFPCVPLSAKEDVTITVSPRGDGVYRVSPYPFAEDPLQVTFTGRHMTPVENAETVDLGAIATGSQTVTLVSD